MKMKELERTVGGLSKPSKMPGLSYGIPAKECAIGSLLRNVKGSVCEDCYAMKGCYVFPVVKEAQERRLAILLADLDGWQKNMTTLIERKYIRKVGDQKVFRWHDSGDIQSVEHFAAIVQIAKDIPTVRFWIPTKEYGIVRKYLRTNILPDNLILRVSAPMIGQSVPLIVGTVSSTVGTGTGFVCGAPDNDGECGDCRACWNPEIVSVDYHKH